ncbi:Hippocampus abundant transcript-like protein 1, partial [Fragariocoptes setiger]
CDENGEDQLVITMVITIPVFHHPHFPRNGHNANSTFCLQQQGVSDLLPRQQQNKQRNCYLLMPSSANEVLFCVLFQLQLQWPNQLILIVALLSQEQRRKQEQKIVVSKLARFTYRAFSLDEPVPFNSIQSNPIGHQHNTCCHNIARNIALRMKLPHRHGAGIDIRTLTLGRSLSVRLLASSKLHDVKSASFYTPFIVPMLYDDNLRSTKYADDRRRVEWNSETLGLDLSCSVAAHCGDDYEHTVANSTLRLRSQKRVAWLKQETRTILSIDTNIITTNYRIFLIPDEEQRKWVLHIKDVQQSDRGHYQCQINTVPTKNITGFLEVVTPPTILPQYSSGETQVDERSNVTLTCKSSSTPKANITWKREDGQPILLSGVNRNYVGSHGDDHNGESHSSDTTSYNNLVDRGHYQSERLTMIYVDRTFSGVYVCTANNGIPPVATRRIPLSINFGPHTRVANQFISASVGDPVELECLIEAFPRSDNYWSKVSTSGQGGTDNIVSSSSPYSSNDQLELMPSMNAAAVSTFNSNGHEQQQGVLSNSQQEQQHNKAYDQTASHPHQYLHQRLVPRSIMVGTINSDHNKASQMDYIGSGDINDNGNDRPVDRHRQVSATTSLVSNPSYVTVKQTMLSNQQIIQLKLFIPAIRRQDFGRYLCRARNHLGVSESQVTIREIAKSPEFLPQRPSGDLYSGNQDQSTQIKGKFVPVRTPVYATTPSAHITHSLDSWAPNVNAQNRVVYDEKYMQAIRARQISNHETNGKIRKVSHKTDQASSLGYTASPSQLPLQAFIVHLISVLGTMLLEVSEKFEGYADSNSGFVTLGKGVGRPSILHVLFVIFAEFFAWGLLTTPLIAALKQTFPNQTLTINGVIWGIKGTLSFLTSPLIGYCSDVLGRKLFLMITVLFTCLPIPVMLISSWSSAYGQVSATFAASMIFGPCLRAYLSSHYGDNLVILIATLVAVVDLLFVYFIVPESLPEKYRPQPSSLWEQAAPLSTFKKIGHDSMIWTLCLAVFLSYLPEAGQYSCFFVYLKLVVGFSEEKVAIFIACVGLASVISQTLLLIYLIKRFGGKKTILIGLVMQAVQLLLLSFGRSQYLMWFTGLIASLSSITYPAISAYVSTYADPDKQGCTQGMITGVRSLCGGIGPAMFGILFNYFNVDVYANPTSSMMSPSSMDLQPIMGFGGHHRSKEFDSSGSSIDSVRQLHNKNGDRFIVGPPFLFGALLVMLATLVATFIPDSVLYQRCPTKPSSSEESSQANFHYTMLPNHGSTPVGGKEPTKKTPKNSKARPNAEKNFKSKSASSKEQSDDDTIMTSNSAASDSDSPSTDVPTEISANQTNAVNGQLR